MLTPAWFKLRKHAVQSRLWHTAERFIAVPCGRGSGKSELARRKLVMSLADPKSWEDPEYFYALPTTEQARRVAWEKIKLLVPRDWKRKENESTMVIRTVFGSTLRVYGLDKPMRVEGIQYDGGIIDESSDIKPKTFDLSFRPAMSHRSGWCWRIGVPKRFGVGAREYKAFCEMCKSKMGDGVHGYYHWPSAGIVSDEEIEIAMNSLDERDFNEQYGGDWETTSGAVYYAYDTGSLTSDNFYDPSKPLMVGSDFNIDPMAWVIMQSPDGKEMVAIDEIWERNTNTQKTLDILWERYHAHTGGWYFFGDASSRARKTSASTSDYLQIRNDERFVGAKVFYPRSNPPVADRVAAVNWSLKARSGRRFLRIHERCVHLRNDLEYLAYKPGSREIDDRDPDAGHITDALGYIVHHVKPMRVDQEVESQVGIF